MISLIKRASRLVQQIRSGPLVAWGAGAITDADGDGNPEFACEYIEVLGFRQSNIAFEVPAGDIARTAVALAESAPIPAPAKAALAGLTLALAPRAEDD